MILKSVVLTLAFLFIAAPLVFGDVTKDDIDAAIDKSKLKHPYLYFTEQEKPAILQRIKNDPESRDIMARLLAEGNRLMFMPVDRNIPIQGKNTRADWTEYDRDGKYENYYFGNRNSALALAFLYQMTGDRKYAQKAFEFADAVCDLQSWTLRAHEFPIIYNRIMPWNVPDDQVVFSFDIFSGDTGRIMAWVYDWLYPALTVPQRDRIRGALLEKVITKVRGNYEYHWWASAYRSNWCSVCNSGVGLAGLALLTEEPQLTDVVAESYNRINKMLNELGVDGGWQEGGVYWNYAIYTSVFFADALKRQTKGKYNLFNNERLRNNPVNFPLYTFVPPATSLHFEDSSHDRIVEGIYLVNKLATETKSKVAAWFREEFFDEGEDIEDTLDIAWPWPRLLMFDIIWPRPTIEPAPPENASIHFRSIDWWIMRSDFKDPEKVLVAGKAGRNDDSHHGHLDIGQFVVYWRGQAYIRDLGSGPYDEKYFDDARWDYPQASSVGHNVVFVNGEKQIPGKMRKQPWNYNVGGKVLEFRSSAERDYVIMDPTNAYPKKEMKGWRRHVTLEKPVITVVVDEVKSDKAAEIEARFHSACAAEINDDYVMLVGNKGKMALIPVVIDGDFTIRPGKHISQPINALKDFSWIPYFGTVVKAGSNKTIIATIILPVDNDSEARRIVNSVEGKVDSAGNLTLSFVKKGKTYSYYYKNDKSGLVLEE